MEYLAKDEERRRKNRERYNRWRERNKEARLAYEKEYVKKNKERKAKYDSEYQRKNKEKIAKRHAAYAASLTAEQREQRKIYQREWYRNKFDATILNDEERKARGRAYKKRNKAKRLNRVPSWLTEEHTQQIFEIYMEAKILELETGDKYHVDHIVPLCGKNVSGLHVPWNLQVLEASENLSKSNKYKKD